MPPPNPHNTCDKAFTDFDGLRNRVILNRGALINPLFKWGRNLSQQLLGAQWCSRGALGAGSGNSPFPGLGTQGQGCGQNSSVQPLGHSSSHSWESLGKRDSSSGLSMLLRHKSGKLVLVKQFSLFWSGSAKCYSLIFTNREYREYITPSHVEEGLP